MKFTEIAKWVIKAIIACMIAFAIVSGGCLLYYNIPVHFDNETGATDYKWETSKFYSRGTEGFALGKTDSDGFNNIEAVNGRQIDILFEGSSHGEAFNVSQKKSCVSVMNELYGEKYFVYNIATSGHTLANLCSNLDASLDTYKPTKYVVLECQSVSLSYQSLEGAVNSTLPKLKSESGGIIGVLQKIPYFRLIYKQISNLKEDESAKDEGTASSPLPDIPDNGYAEILDRFIKKIKKSSDDHGVKAIIVYHPHLIIEKDGSVCPEYNESYISLFRKTCSENGVVFIDMTDDFISAYNSEHKLPHGFTNTNAGKGHLNSFGHRLLAERICKTTEDMEAEK